MLIQSFDQIYKIVSPDDHNMSEMTDRSLHNSDFLVTL
jgi:hypothetical protein